MPNTTRKLPKRHFGFAWSRIPVEDGSIIYRLFRRDMRGVLHVEKNTILPGEQRWYIALWLRHARKRLRDRVDEIDLQILGVTP